MIELKLLVAAISRVLDDMTGNKSCGKAMMTKNVDGMYEGSGALVVRVASGVGPSTTGSELVVDSRMSNCNTWHRVVLHDGTYRSTTARKRLISGLWNCHDDK